jgi:peptide/nickel transport system permease protein
MSRSSALTAVAVVVLVAWALVSIAAPQIAPYDPLGQNLAERLAPPSSRHWFGTDPLGRDIWSRTLYGARISIPVGIAAVALAVLFGTLVGVVSGSMGKLVDEILMRTTELMLAFPSVILALVITAALGAGIGNALIAIAIAWWPQYARIVRGLVLSVKERDYVQGAYAIGASEARVVVRHVLPNIAPSVIVLATLDVGHAILTFASLSFLGLGPPPQTPEWGAMIAAGRNHFDQWWIGTFPGIAILSVSLAFNVLGDSIRDALDPRLRTL